MITGLKKNKGFAQLLITLSFFCLLCLAAVRVNASLVATGSANDPFTDLSQTHTVLSEGTYYFNIDGVTFSTHVDAEGWVMVLRDDDQDQTSNPLDGTTTLSLSSTDNILSPTVLATLGEAIETKMRLFSSDGTIIIDATSPDSRYIDAITANQSLYPGWSTVGGRDIDAHDAMAQTWVGTGAAYMGVGADSSICDTEILTNLSDYVYHICGTPHTLIAVPGTTAGFIHKTTQESYSELYVRAINPFDPDQTDNTGALPSSNYLSSGTTHELLDFSSWPNAVIDVSVDAFTECSSHTAHTSVRIDTQFDTLYEISHHHYGDTSASSDGLYGDGTDEVTTRKTIFASHGLRIEDDKLLFVSYGNTCGSNTKVNGGSYWVFVKPNVPPTIANPVADQQAMEGSPFSISLPTSIFTDTDNGDSVTVSVSAKPNWLSFAGGILSGTPTNDHVGSHNVTVTGTDNSEAAISDTFVVTVVNVNNPPVLANPMVDQNATEDSPFSISLPTSMFSDIDSGDSVSVSVSAKPSWLSFASGILFGTPTNAHVGNHTVTVTGTDGSSATVNDTFIITVANTNDAPTVANVVADQNITEDSPFSINLPVSIFNDQDAGDSVTLSVTTKPSWLSFNAGTLSGTPNNSHLGDHNVTVTGTDNFGATATESFVIRVVNTNDSPTVDKGINDQAATEDVAFSLSIPSDAFSDPDVSDTLSYALTSSPDWLTLSGNTLEGTPAQADVGNVAITLRATDTGALFADASFIISIAEVNNNAPVFNSASAISVSENPTEAVYRASTSDIDSGDTVAFALSGTDAGLFSINATTGDLSFIASPDFENPTDTGNDAVYNLDISATDAATNSASLSLTITLTDVNDNAPSFTSAVSHSAPEGNGSTGFIASATDLDTNDTLAFAIVGGDDAAHFNINVNSGVLSFAHALDFEQPQDADRDNTYKLILRGRDAASNDAFFNLDVVLQDTNDNAPSFMSGSTVSVDENNIAVGYTALATDPDTNDTITYGIESGLDGARFNIDPNTGVLSFITAPDAEAPTDADGNNIYLLTLSATDLSSLSTTMSLAVTVVDLNDTTPHFISPPVVSISEDNYSVGYTALATDPDTADASALTLSYSITGGADAALFNIVNSTGQVSFNTAPDFEAPDDSGLDHIYNLILEVSDTVNNTSVHNVTINLLDANDNAPLFTSLPNASIPEGSVGVFYTATATDPDTNDSVTFSISDGNEAGLFSINPNSGALSVSAVDFENPGSGSTNNVYSLTLRGTDSGGLTKDYVVAVTVADINDNPPTITSFNSIQIDENATATGYSATATDPDTNDSLTWSFGGGDDDALMAINSTSGELTFVTAPDFEAPTDTNADNVYAVTITATDAANNSSDFAFTVTVNNSNDNAPVFSSSTSVSINEGSTASPYTAIAADIDNNAVHYQIDGGTDAALFSIDLTTGVLSFDQAPDYEAPQDDDEDNIYNLVLAAIDSDSQRTIQNIVIIVNDINDNAPTFSSGATASVAEGSSATGYSAISTDPDSNDTIAYSLSGSDASLFNIAANGHLSFANSTNYEKPADANADNIYEVTITATDAATNSTDQVVSVTVSDINEPPIVANSLHDQTASEDSSFNYTVPNLSFTDVDSSLTLSVSSTLPDWLSFNVSTLYGTPLSNDVGTVSVTIRATDDAGLWIEDSFTIAIANTNHSPTVDKGINDQAATEDVAFSLSIPSDAFSDPDESDTLSYALTSSPDWLTLSGNTLEGTPTQADVGDVAITLRATDTGALFADASFIISIAGANNDENDITDLFSSLPIDTATLISEGVNNIIDSRDEYYNNAIAAANPKPSTLAELQAIIDEANAAAEIVESVQNETESSVTIDKLTQVGITGLVAANASAYQLALLNADPLPTTQAQIQAIIDEINAIEIVLKAAQLFSNSSLNSANDAFIAALAELSSLPEIPTILLVELAAMLLEANPRPTSAEQIADVSNNVIERATNHPVIYLTVEQGGVQVSQVRVNGGKVTITAHVANPLPDLTVSYDWSKSSTNLYTLSIDANPITNTFSFDPSVLTEGDRLNAIVSIDRNGLLANGNMQIQVAPFGADPLILNDSDGDGITDQFEGDLDATVDPAAANKLQTVKGDDLFYLMEGETGVFLRLGEVARRAKANQVNVSLDDVVEHSLQATAEQVIDSLPTMEPVSSTEVFDFEIASIGHAGASVSVVIPLQNALKANAAYYKFNTSTGWKKFVIDGQNRLSSAPVLLGIMGQCPPVGHEAFSEGLTEGDACIQLRIQDGGKNDADRITLDGTVAEDAGVNGNIVDPGAIVYPLAEAGGEDPDIDPGKLHTGLNGSGGAAASPASLVMFALITLFVSICRRPRAKRRLAVRTMQHQ